MIHFLGTLRHFVYFAYDPWDWVTNVSAATIQFATVILIVKVFRKRAEAFIHRAVHKFVKPHLDAHLESVKAHLTAELERLK